MITKGFTPAKVYFDIVNTDSGRITTTLEAANVIAALGELKRGVYLIQSSSEITLAVVTVKGDGTWMMRGGRKCR